MIWAEVNAAAVALQAYALGPDGAAKLDVTGGTVRVYHLDGAGAEVEDLVPTALANTHTNVWRYVWEPTALPAGEYVVELALTDVYGLTARTGDDLVVRGYAQQSTLLLVQADLALVRKVEAGRWRIIANQMVFYDDDNTTPLLTFNLKNEAGLPAMDNVFERVPA